ncbi:MAG: DUF2357 domain-containing protein [Lachnospiraceae bacterium]|nr:DUF2357 domain-containing protein [Clostridiales bacterium]MDD6293437.1 DUF2357 domain-containing protein [Eubacteriales bacterium]MDY2607616.1 DUF2357 domain-containing protein [Lachnospiraceae bacterium]
MEDISNINDNEQEDKSLRPFDEEKDVVQNVYDKIQNMDSEVVKEDDFYKYFYNLLDTSTNFCTFKYVKLVKNIDEEWISAIEEALPSLHHVVMNPRKFIEEDREIVNMAMARNITTESLRHLIQHSNLIDKYDEDGTVIPNRILNVFKEESLNIYENRFICTLIAELQHFVNKRYNVIFENTKDELGAFFKMESIIDNYTETVDYKLQVNIRDKQSDEKNEKDNDDIFQRLVKIHRQVNGLASTEFITEMRTMPSVRHPIVKTNAIKKNMYYKACYKLWNFIYSYNKVGYTVDLVKREPVISKAFEKDIYDSFIFNYAMLHNQVEDPYKLDINKKKKEKNIDVKYIRQSLEEIVDNSGMSIDNLKRLINNELTAIDERKKREANEVEKLRRKSNRTKTDSSE